MKVLGIDFSCAPGALSNGQFPEKDCLLPLISTLLGYAIVAASTTVKLPQILKILEHGSIRGLSILSFELELVGYTIALAYCLHGGLPFSAYGELAFLLIQALILVAIMYYYSQPVSIKRWMTALLYCGIAPTILAGRIDPVLFEALYASQHAIFLFAKIPQIWQNFSHKSTGELSFLTNFMNFGGSMVRVFTSIQEQVQKVIVLACTVADWREPFSLPRGWLLWAGIGLVGAVVAVALTGAATSFFSGQTPEREIKAFGMILRMGQGLWVPFGLQQWAVKDRKWYTQQQLDEVRIEVADYLQTLL